MPYSQLVTESLQPFLRRVSRPVVFIAALVAAASVLPAQVTVFVTRHADREASEPDAALTALGLRQAETLSEVLRSAGITHIYTTEFIRTQQTAAPLARISKAPIEVVKEDDLHELIARILRNTTAGDAILVVGHRGTVPQIVKALSGKAIKPLGSVEYGRLLAVTLFPDGKSSVVTLRYWPVNEPEQENEKGEAK